VWAGLGAAEVLLEDLTVLVLLLSFSAPD